ncbi:MAG: maleate cis-trans isomerase family protein [Hyphomicrobiaceae bacterium]
MLTPSSNTVLEPVTTAMLAGIDRITVHFSRFKVTEIALSDRALGQFDDAPILRAAELLGDAKVDTIAWNGTSASWLGFERDEHLVARIRSATGIAACTCVLAFREIFQRTGTKRIGLVTPYTGDVQDKIEANWIAAGFFCSAERHLGIRDNFAFAGVAQTEIEDMIRAVVREGAEAAAIVCTNLKGAAVAARLETELDVPIYDSVAVTLWKSLKTAGVSPAVVQGWGRLFTDLA